MLLEEETIKKPEKTVVKKEKSYVALKTVKITCNKEFDLVQDTVIPKDIHKSFIESLINSKIIKEA